MTRARTVVCAFAAVGGVFVACAQGAQDDGSSLIGGDGGANTTTDAADTGTLIPVTDGQSGSDSGAEAAPLDSGSCTPTLVVNELAPQGPAGSADEYVEIYNASTCAVSFGGYTLGYYASDGNGSSGGPIALYAGKSGDTIPKGGYFVVAGGSFTGTSQAALASGLANGAGRVGIVDPTSKTMDALAYGAQTGPTTFIEGTAAAAPATTAQSIARHPDGHDTNNNSADFTSGTRSPGAAN